MSEIWHPERPSDEECMRRWPKASCDVHGAFFGPPPAACYKCLYTDKIESLQSEIERCKKAIKFAKGRAKSSIVGSYDYYTVDGIEKILGGSEQ